MDGRPADFSIAAHIDAISARTEADGDRLSASLLGQSWPGGVFDRSEQAARDWLRRWRPRRAAVQPIACECASGRCLVCN
jgi:hypothetical protein